MSKTFMGKGAGQKRYAVRGERAERPVAEFELYFDI
jgi:hypothetical protein